MLEVENLILTRVPSLSILLLPSEQVDVEEECRPPNIMHLPTLQHFRCEVNIDLDNIIGSQSRLVSLHLPRHSFYEVVGRINLMSLTSLTLNCIIGLERENVPVLRDLSTKWIEGVHGSIIPHLTSLTGRYFEDDHLHPYTELVTLTMTVDYSQLLKWSFDGIIRLPKLKTLSLRILESSRSPVLDEGAYVVSVVKELNALMLQHPTLEHLYICCQHDDHEEPSKVLTLQITNLSLAKYSKVDLQLCTDRHCFSVESSVILHQHDCFYSRLFS